MPIAIQIISDMLPGCRNAARRFVSVNVRIVLVLNLM